MAAVSRESRASAPLFRERPVGAKSRYLRYPSFSGWVRTFHSAQGTTCDRVLAHLESFRRNVDANLVYVAVSRAKKDAAIYTDDRGRLTRNIKGPDGAKVGAIDDTLIQKGIAIAIPVPVKVMGVAIG